MNDAGFIGRKDEYHVLEKCYHSKDAQIDLVIDHRDNVASLCEMKFTMNEFEINKDIYMDLMNKIAAFQSENKRKISSNRSYHDIRIKGNRYSNAINKCMTLDAFLQNEFC